MTAAVADPGATGPFSPGTLSVFSQLLSGYNLSAGDPNFEQVAGAIALARRELADAIVAAGMVEGAGPAVVEADVELEEPGLRVVGDDEEARPAPNRQARRTADKAKPRPRKRT